MHFRNECQDERKTAFLHLKEWLCIHFGAAASLSVVEARRSERERNEKKAFLSGGGWKKHSSHRPSFFEIVGNPHFWTFCLGQMWKLLAVTQGVLTMLKFFSVGPGTKATGLDWERWNYSDSDLANRNEPLWRKVKSFSDLVQFLACWNCWLFLLRRHLTWLNQFLIYYIVGTFFSSPSSGWSRFSGYLKSPLLSPNPPLYHKRKKVCEKPSKCCWANKLFTSRGGLGGCTDWGYVCRSRGLLDAWRSETRPRIKKPSLGMAEVVKLRTYFCVWNAIHLTSCELIF